MICDIAVFYVELLTQRASVRKNFVLQVRQPWLLPVARSTIQRFGVRARGAGAIPSVENNAVRLSAIPLPLDWRHFSD